MMEKILSSPVHQKRAAAYLLLAINIFIVSWFWAANLHTYRVLGVHSVSLALGHICGLLSVLSILLQLLLMSRMPFFEDAFGFELLNKIHRKNGYVAFGLLAAHIIFTTLGYQFTNYVTFATQTMLFIHNFEDVFKAILGFVLLIGVTWMSAKIVRRHFRYETWYFVHLTAYLAVILAWGHQLKVGPDFVGHPLFVGYWYVLYGMVAVILVFFRFGNLVANYFSHQFYVAGIYRETHDTVTLKIKGKNIDKFRYRAGQFAIWHILAPKMWWQWHPFSFSSAPGGSEITLTAKQFGDYTKLLDQLKPGTPVIVDGPHGNFIDETRKRSKVLYITGGVGITPIFSMLQQTAPAGLDIILLYACRSPEDIVFRSSLAQMSEQHPNLRIYYFFSRAPQRGMQYIDEVVLERYVPDLLERDAYVCGPPKMMDSLREALINAGLDKHYIHSERFDL